MHYYNFDIKMFKSQNDGWEIVIPKAGEEFDLEGKLKTFAPEDIALKEGVPIVSDRIFEENIERKWKEFIQLKRKLGHPEPVNDGLVRLSNLPFINEDGKIELRLAQTNYKEHIPSFYPDEFSRKLPFGQRSNVLNSIAVPVTVDNYVVYSVRGDTATFPNELSGFGSPLHTPEEISAVGPKYLFAQVKDVVARESGIRKYSEEDLIEVRLGGFVYIRDGFNVPLWIADINLEKKEVEEIFRTYGDKKIRGSIMPKYAGIDFVKLDEDSYGKFLVRPELARTVKPVWAYLGIQKFGTDFVKAIM